jgi:hypothetical protein
VVALATPVVTAESEKGILKEHGAQNDILGTEGTGEEIRTTGDCEVAGWVVATAESLVCCT